MEITNDEIYNYYSIFTHPTENDQEFQEAHDFILDFVQKSDCVDWIISTYSEINDVLIRIQQLIQIQRWCRLYWNDLPQEVRSEFKNLLFTQSNHEEFRSNETFNNVLADAQLSFMWGSFPDTWPQFWQVFLDSFDENYFLNFLFAFAKFVSIHLDGNENYQYNKIKNAMRDNNTDFMITQFTIDMMEKEELKAYFVFSNLCKWVNVSYLLDDKPVGLIVQGLDNPDCASYSLDILSCLMNRGIQFDVKFSLITELSITDRIHQLMDAISSEDINPHISYRIAISAATLVSSAGEVVLQSKEIEPFYDLALDFLLHDNNEISVMVVSLLIQICKELPECSNKILLKSLDRLVTYIESEEDDTGYLDMIYMLSNATLKAKPEENCEELLKQWDDGNLLGSNPNLAVSIISIVGKFLADGEPQEFVRRFIEQFINILNVEPPIDRTFSFGINCFIKFFISVGGDFSKEEISYVFKELCRLVLIGFENEDEEIFHNKIAFSLNQFLKKLDSKIDFDPDVIYEFVSTLDEQLVAAAGCLIHNLNQNQRQSEIFQDCMDKLQEGFSQIDAENQKSFIPIILSFIKSVKYEENAPHISDVIQFLKDFLEECSSDDTLFALYIRTTYSSLGKDCFDIVMSCTDHIDIGYQSISAFCDVVLAMIKCDSIEKGDWITYFTDNLFELIPPKFKSVQSWDTELKSDDSNQILEMTCNFIHLFEYAFKIATDFIDPQTYASMKQFIIELLSQHFDLPNLVESCIDFLTSMIKNDLDSIYEDGLIKYMVFFFYTNKFNPSLKPWFRVCKRVLSFHHRLLEEDPDRAKEAIASSLGEFISDSNADGDEIIDSYFSVLGQERPRDQVSEGRQYFINFSKVLISQG